MSDSYRQAKASVKVIFNEDAYVVTETPSEVREARREILSNPRSDGMIELTMGNKDEWNGKPVYIKASDVEAILPPMNMEDDDE